ncbi:MAG: class I SAM-dependent methyltransferase [Pseudonocardiaceae bacterium]
MIARVLTADELFWAAFTDLPRGAPGSEATTRLLLELAGPLPPTPRLVDIGCGAGPATLLLAQLTGGEIIAVDTHEPLLGRLRTAADEAGRGKQIRTLNASMEDLPLPDGSADVVWAEGSVYVMGFDAALSAWRRLLAPGGVLVLTEAEWTTPEPAAVARAFWNPAYPAMRTTAGNVAAAQDAGWTVAAVYLLPDRDWDVYYRPLAARLGQLRARYPEHVGDLDDLGAEIDIRAAHGGDYGYTGYILRPR